MNEPLAKPKANERGTGGWGPRLPKADGAAIPPIKMDKDIALQGNDKRSIEGFCKRVKGLLGNDLVRLALFGSKLTAKDTPESDIDVLVLIKDEAMDRKGEILEAAFEINVDYGVYISPRVIPLSTFNNPVWSQTPFLRGVRENGLTL